MRLTRQTGWLLAKAGISLVVLVQLTRGINWASFWMSAASVNLMWLASSIAVLIVCSVVGAVRWHHLLPIHQIAAPFFITLRVTFIGVFFNSFLFGSSGGDAVRIYLIAKESKVSKTVSAWSVLTDRLLGIVALLTTALLFLITPSGEHHPGELERVRRYCALALALFAVLAMFALLLSRKLLATSRFRPGGVWAEGTIAKSLRAVLTLREHPVRLLTAFGLSMGIVLLLVVSGFCLASALAVPLGIAALSVIVPTMLVTTSLPISIGGFGIREGTFVVLFTLYGVGDHTNTSVALQFSLFWFFISLVTSLVGAVFFFTSPTSLHSLRKDVQDG